MDKINIALIPIDNRPVCYQLPKQIVDITDKCTLSVPPINLLGSLKKSAEIDKLFDWLESQNSCDYIILSLDTLIYGGLINSRKGNDSNKIIIERLERLKRILEEKNCKVLAFSSVMRISNNNINVEEKEYWSEWGKKIFDWSYNYHCSLKNNDNEASSKYNCISNLIPQNILDDYLDTRKRNFEVNLVYLEWVKAGILDFIIYSKDDCAKFGLNVMEAEGIEKLIRTENLNAIIKTGADEIPLTLLARVFSDLTSFKIYPEYTQPEYKNKISKYEDISVNDAVIASIIDSNNIVAKTKQEADFVLLINNFKNEQGELVMGVDEAGFNDDFCVDEKPVVIADILNANGADNLFVNTLLKKDWSNLKGYSAWNTTGNTLGTAVCMGMASMMSNISVNFKKVLFTRFCDDWAYQSNVREVLKKENTFIPETLMKPFADIINTKLNTSFEPIYSFPWDRHFEIRIDI